ncbi:unnamed protein product [Cuscuta campestris]|uniref:Uncharacterized protein n=1 Tax=Cuscuta campestris TaxID=132261 RepID=A0A484L6F4_9ASTE|nr:unnamed protein product [Cuscuta campestris]
MLVFSFPEISGDLDLDLDLEGDSCDNLVSNILFITSLLTVGSALVSNIPAGLQEHDLWYEAYALSGFVGVSHLWTVDFETSIAKLSARVKRLSKGTSITTGRWSNDEESCVDKEEGEEGCSGGGIEGNKASEDEVRNICILIASPGSLEDILQAVDYDRELHTVRTTTGTMASRTTHFLDEWEVRNKSVVEIELDHHGYTDAYQQWYYLHGVLIDVGKQRCRVPPEGNVRTKRYRMRLRHIFSILAQSSTNINPRETR